MAHERFDGRVLFCTGAGSGIAAAVSRQYTREGGRVAVVDVNGDGAEAVAAEIGGIPLVLDVSDEEAVAAAVKTTLKELGRIDGVYNGAGNMIVGGTQQATGADLMRMLEVHALGTYLCCRETAAALRESGSGSIVNTSSIGSYIARHDRAAYGAAKGAVHVFTRHLALELAPTIRVNSIAPGRTLTAMAKPMYERLGNGDLAAGMEEAASALMLRRIADPDEVATAACFLLSDDASYITAQCLVVDGGMTAE